MSLRPVELELLAAELSRELSQAAVQKVSCPTASRVYLELRVPGRTVTLLWCADRGLARLSAVGERPPNPANPPAWQSVLRRELTGARLVEAEAWPARRVLVTRFEVKGRRLGLALEVGAEPQLVLVGDAGRALALSSPPRAGLRVGKPWALPDERPVGDQPSRLSGDVVHLRLAHAAEALFADTERQRWLDARRAPLRASIKRLERTLVKVRDDLARTARADDVRREGELLAHNLHRLSRGDEAVTLTEWLEDGSTREVRIALDPRRTPKEEVSSRFHQYRRLQRGAAVVRARLDTLEAQLEATRAELAGLDATAAPTAPPPPPRQPSKAPAQAPAPPYREYSGLTGARIWVGRGGAHNDELTFHVARPWHVWLHVRGAPGAHVVLPLEKGAVPSSEALVDAAHLALHHSSLRGEPRAEVAWTQVKFVRKTKGAAPGLVTYTREKSLLLRVEPQRLAALLQQTTP